MLRVVHTAYVCTHCTCYSVISRSNQHVVNGVILKNQLRHMCVWIKSILGGTNFGNTIDPFFFCMCNCGLEKGTPKKLCTFLS